MTEFFFLDFLKFLFCLQVDGESEVAIFRSFETDQEGKSFQKLSAKKTKLFQVNKISFFALFYIKQSKLAKNLDFEWAVLMSRKVQTSYEDFLSCIKLLP